MATDEFEVTCRLWRSESFYNKIFVVRFALVAVSHNMPSLEGPTNFNLCGAKHSESHSPFSIPNLNRRSYSKTYKVPRRRKPHFPLQFIQYKSKKLISHTAFESARLYV